MIGKMDSYKVPKGLPYSYYGVEFVPNGVGVEQDVLGIINRYLVENGRGLVHRASSRFWYADALDGADGFYLLRGMRGRILEDPDLRNLISEVYWYEPGFRERVA